MAACPQACARLGHNLESSATFGFGVDHVRLAPSSAASGSSARMLHSSLGSGPLSSRAKRLRAVYWDTIGENEIRGALHRCFPASVNCPGQSAGAFFPRASLGRVQWKILPRAFPEGLRGHPTRREGKKPGALSLWSEGSPGNSRLCGRGMTSMKRPDCPRLW